MEETCDIVDIGVNLAHRSFQKDREAVIQRACAAGVRTMIVTGTSLAVSEAASKIAQASPNHLLSTAGVHPHDSRNCNEQTIADLRRLAANEQVVAIGECGLDFNRDFSPRPIQEKWFEAQIALAEELEMPLFLHERDAEKRFCEIMTAVRKNSPAVVHCFTGNGQALKAYLEWDFTSASPGGFVTNVEESISVNWSETFRSTGSCSKRTPHFCCRGLCRSNRRMDAMNPAFCQRC